MKLWLNIIVSVDLSGMTKYLLFYFTTLICLSCKYSTQTKESSVCNECIQFLDPQHFISPVQLAYQALEFSYDLPLAEKLLREQIHKHRSSRSIDSLVFLACHYLVLPEISGVDPKFTQELVQELENLELAVTQPILSSLMHYSLNHHYYQQSQALPCFSHAYKILSSKTNDNQPIQVLYHLALAKSSEVARDFKTSIKNFLSGYYLAEEAQVEILRNKVLSELSSFYIRSNLHEKAFEYKLMELKNSPKDSLNYYFALLSKLECIRKMNSDGSYNLQEWYSIVDFAIRNKARRLEEYAFAFFRTSMIDAGRPEDLLNIYDTRYPLQFKRFKEIQKISYLRLLAAYYESVEKMDSAQYFYTESIRNCEQKKLSTGIRYSIYLRYGDFAFRKGNINEAVKAYLVAFEATKSMKITEYQLQVAKKLKDIFQEQHKDNDAVRYILSYQALQDKVDSIMHDREVVKMELDNSEQIHLLQKRFEEESKLNIYENQYRLIAIFILMVFIVLLAAAQFHVPIWIIRSLGFLAFIFLFEFLIIRLDKPLHSLAHDVPWKLFGIKVALFAFLLPFHHWIEKKVVGFLLERRNKGGTLLQLNGSIFKKWFTQLNRTEE